ncbi:MAG: DUF3375 family protein [Treponema sp.]|nr:DUF3375 family protein [Treponema sp.]
MKSFTASYFDSILKTDSGFTLLRSRSAHLVLSFLYQTFRINHIQSVNSDEFETRLTFFLQEHLDEKRALEEDEMAENFNKNKENAEIQLRASDYIKSWCEKKDYIRRYYNRDGVAVIELNPGIERLFNWLETCEQKEFVGTESRFQNILFRLRDLHQHINAAPETRIAELKNKKAEIDEEINRIKKTGEVQTYSPAQIQERLMDIDKNSHELLSDFRQVEENFRTILNGIYKKQSEDDSSRAAILGYTLDTDSKLRNSLQGQSFATFWNFLSQDSENEINTIVRDIVLKSQSSNDFLLQLKHYLYEAGHKIIEQNRMLTDRITRVLKQETAGERKQIANLITSIKKGMHEYKQKIENGSAKVQSDFMKIEAKPLLDFRYARVPQFYSPNYELPEVKSFDVQAVNPSDFSELFTQFYIDEKKLLQNIEFFKEANGEKQFTLKEFLNRFPLEKGIAEFVAFFGLTRTNDKIIICEKEFDEIMIQNGTVVYKIRAPRLLFL